MLNDAAEIRDRSGGKPSDQGHSVSDTASAGSATSKTLASTEKLKTAAAEIVETRSVSNRDPLGDMIVRGKAVANGQSVFKESLARIFDGLEVANEIYHLIKNNKAQHQRVIDELMVKGDRERAPSLNKAAYNATVLACHPESPEEYTNCSDWQNVILLADIENVTADAFAEWVKDKKIGESKRKVRAAKQAKKPLKTPFFESELPMLAAAFRRCDVDPTMRELLKEALIGVEQQLS